jgi:hypothetical protein
MSNHLHLLIETRDVPLSKALQGINQSYTMYFNWKYRTVGHLFQGRYKAILCDRERYLLALLKYLHHNPVRAKITENPAQYRWSSDRNYRTRDGGGGIVDTDTVLRMFSEHRGRARKKYEEFIDDGITVKKQDVYAVIDQRLLGDERFIDQVTEQYGGPVKKERRKKEYTLARIAEAVGKAVNVTLEDMRSGGRRREVVQGRVGLTVLAKEYGYLGKEIAEYLKKDPTAVTLYGRKLEEAQETIKAVDLLLRGKKN